MTAIMLIWYSDLISADAYLIQKIIVPLSLIGTTFFHYIKYIILNTILLLLIFLINSGFNQIRRNQEDFMNKVLE